MTDNNGCTANDSATVSEPPLKWSPPDDKPEDTATEVEELSEKQDENVLLKVFPNPTSGNVFIDINGLNEDVQELIVFVYDMYGKEVYFKKLSYGRSSYVLKLENRFVSGMYFLNVIADDKAYRQKLVIQR